jgi:hypothetical protein
MVVDSCESEFLMLVSGFLIFQIKGTLGTQIEMEETDPNKDG